jgi:magnesium chelatase family protein
VLATVLSAAVRGLDGIPLAVEVDLQPGLRCFHIVGLPSPAVRESRERVVSALLNAGFDVPERRVTVNLAPADLPKEGAAFDLSIALGILRASEQYTGEGLGGTCVLGELALDGLLRPTRGVLPIAIALRRLGVPRLLVPQANMAEAELVPGLEVWGCRTLSEAADRTGGVRRTAKPRRRRVARGRTGDTPEDPVSAHEGIGSEDSPAVAIGSASSPTCAADAQPDDSPETELCGAGLQRSLSQNLVVAPPHLDFSQVHGQEVAKRAFSVAAAGGHHILLAGPPGVGKSMLARCLPGLLPPLSEDEGLEVRQVLSVCGLHEAAAAPVVHRPFRAPHHTITVPALVGGGRPVVPGEITRAHHGVLFLDEMPEFPRLLLDLLRQPLEEGSIRLARANQTIAFPSQFQLVGAMNGCPCGNLGRKRKPCKCTPGEVQRYQAKISGPILDRIDLRVEVGVPTVEKIGTSAGAGAGIEAAVEFVAANARLRERIAAARVRQARRYANSPDVHCNAQVGPEERRDLIRPRREAALLLQRAVSQWDLSLRAHDKTLAVARTIADLDGASDIDVQHVAEALQYRLRRHRP